MGLRKKVYTDNETIITAESMNNIQDAILELEDGLFSVDNDKSGAVISITDAAKRGFRSLNIYGKTTQAGTPTPDAPVDLVSTGADGYVIVTVSGANLMPSTYATFEKNGITIVFNGNAATVKGTNTAETPVNTNGPLAIPLPIAKGNYSVTTSADNVFPQVSIINTDGTVSYHSRNYSLIGTEQRVNLYLEVKGGATVNTTINLMVNTGDTLLPFEPYKCQTVTVSTPNGLPGIPVASGGNYTDANGQQWVCNEIDFKRGKLIVRVFSETITENLQFIETPDWAGRFVSNNCLSVFSKTGRDNALSNFAKYEPWGYGYNGESFAINSRSMYYHPETEMTADEVTAMFADMIASETPPVVIGQLIDPEEIDLTEEELAAYASLHTYKDNTTVFNDAGAYMDLEYVMDAKKYIDSLVTGGIATARVE